MKITNQLYLFPVFMIMGLLLFASCTDQGNDVTAPDPPVPTAMSWSDVGPIFQANCVSCHGGSGGLFLDTYANAIAGGNHGAAIIPGDAGNSLLYELLVGSSQGIAQMPVGGSLTNDEIDTIEEWIDDGALEFPPE